MLTVDIHSCFTVYAEQTFVNTLWLLISAANNSSNAHCFKIPSISVIFKSTAYLPPVKLNDDYQKIMHVQGLQLCSSYSH